MSKRLENLTTPNLDKLSNLKLMAHSDVSIKKKGDVDNLFLMALEQFSLGHFDEAISQANKVAAACQNSCEVFDRDYRKSPRYSIIIVTYGDSKDFIYLLSSLQKYICQTDFELIIVNNGNIHVRRYLEEHLKRYRLIEVGFNYGCSGGRNIGTMFSSGKYVIFLDDDGLIDGRAIDILVSTALTKQAVSVRGKVLPKNRNGRSARGYNKGDLIIPSIPDAEGISIWDKDIFLEFGGFDPLLYGHEGSLLFCKMFRFFSPESFLYDPRAILYHDYLPTKERQEKREIYQKLADKYFYHLNIDKIATIQQFYKFDKPTRELDLFQYSSCFIKANDSDKEPVSIITTAKNGIDFIEDYTYSLKQQTRQNFEIIFVDDGSKDLTIQKITDLWRGDDRLNLIETQGIGRSAALNLALQHTSHEICLIADVDDISVPQRIEWTLGYFAEHLRSGCVAFSYFNEQSFYGWGRPVSKDLARIKARALLGMPVPFPSFSFRKSEFRLPFESGVAEDCDWIFRNVRNRAPDGHFITRNAVYYRIHEQQISAIKREEQISVALRCIKEFHGDYLGDISDADGISIMILSSWKKPEKREQIDQTLKYIGRLAQAIKVREDIDCEPMLSLLHFRALELMHESRTIVSQIARTSPKKSNIKYFNKNYWINRRRRLQQSLIKRLERGL